MPKGKLYFKHIREQVIQHSPINNENIPINPKHKPSFKGLTKKNPTPIINKPPTSFNSSKNLQSPISSNRLQRVDSCKENLLTDRSNKDCNKFSNLL